MAYKRGLPTFNKDTEVKKTVIQNPDGTTTYRDTWSSKKPARSTSFKAPTSAKTGYVAKRSTPAQTTSGSREVTSIPSLKPVRTIPKMEITAPLPEAVKKPVTRKELAKTTETYREKEWLKDNPGKTTEDRDKSIQKRKAQLEREYNKESKGFKGMFSSKKAVNPCKTC
jgi:hypothetical protein